jgi:hypothetical protein
MKRIATMAKASSHPAGNQIVAELFADSPERMFVSDSSSAARGVPGSRPVVQLTILSAHTESGDVARPRRHFAEQPTSTFRSIGPRRQKRVSFSRFERNVELVQRKR